MKLIRNIALSAFLTIGAFSTMLYTSCNPDACKDVVCNNGGTCLNGTCQCPSGYEGTSCQTVSADAIKGTYTATETCQPPLGSSSSWTSVVTISANDPTRVVISNFGESNTNVTGHVNKNAITLDATTIGTHEVTGTGTINGNVITISYQMGTLRSCNMTMTLQ